MGIQSGKMVNRLERMQRKCGPRGAHAHVSDRNLFIFDRIADGWTQEECAWALDISLPAIYQRLTKIRTAVPHGEPEPPRYREVNDGTDVWWRCIDGVYHYRLLQHGTWRALSAEDAAAIVHPKRVAAMAEVKAQPMVRSDESAAA